MAQKHVIKRQVLEIDLPRGSEGTVWHAQLAEVAQEKLRGILDDLCQEIDNPKLLMRIERLEVDLGEIPNDGWEEELPFRLEKALRKEFSDVLSQNPERQRKGVTTQQTLETQGHWELAKTWLISGRLPWWGTSLFEGSLPALLQKLAAEQPGTLRTHLPALLQQDTLANRRWQQQVSLPQQLAILLGKKEDHPSVKAWITRLPIWAKQTQRLATHWHSLTSILGKKSSPINELHRWTQKLDSFDKAIAEVQGMVSDLLITAPDKILEEKAVLTALFERWWGMISTTSPNKTSSLSSLGRLYFPIPEGLDDTWKKQLAKFEGLRFLPHAIEQLWEEGTLTNKEALRSFLGLAKTPHTKGHTIPRTSTSKTDGPAANLPQGQSDKRNPIAENTMAASKGEPIDKKAGKGDSEIDLQPIESNGPAPEGEQVSTTGTPTRESAGNTKSLTRVSDLRPIPEKTAGDEPTSDQGSLATPKKSTDSQPALEDSSKNHKAEDQPNSIPTDAKESTRNNSSKLENVPPTSAKREGISKDAPLADTSQREIPSDESLKKYDSEVGEEASNQDRASHETQGIAASKDATGTEVQESASTVERPSSSPGKAQEKSKTRTSETTSDKNPDGKGHHTLAYDKKSGSETAAEKEPLPVKPRAAKAPPYHPPTLDRSTWVGEEIYIENAGLILLWPFLGYFFRGLGLLQEGNTWQDATAHERAVYLLQGLMPPETVVDEPHLVLNKIITGWPLDEPLHPPLPFSQKEQEEMDGLLNAAIGQWAALGKTSPESFSRTFLAREGRLMAKTNKEWVLRVHQTPFDVLMDTLPWSRSIVRLAWAPDVIYVEW